MTMLKIINIIQVITSILLVISILLQQRGEGGLSPVFGGGGSGSYRTRRGLERILSWATVILAIVFIGSAIAATLFVAS